MNNFLKNPTKSLSSLCQLPLSLGVKTCTYAASMNLITCIYAASMNLISQFLTKTDETQQVATLGETTETTARDDSNYG